MPNPDQMLFIQGIQQLANDIRGAGATMGQRQQFQQQQDFQTQQAELARQFAQQQQTERLGQQQTQFEDRQKQERDLQTQAEKAALTRAQLDPKARDVNANIGGQKLGAAAAEFFSGGNHPVTGLPTVSIEKVKDMGTSAGQGRYLLNLLGTVSGMAEEHFNQEAIDSLVRALQEELIKAGGVNTGGLIPAIKLRKNETKEQYLKRVAAWREMLRANAIKEEKGRSGVGKLRGKGTAEKARAFVAPGQYIMERLGKGMAKDAGGRDLIEDEVTEKFGGLTPDFGQLKK
jgi:hypothetical protein